MATKQKRFYQISSHHIGAFEISRVAGPDWASDANYIGRVVREHAGIVCAAPALLEACKALTQLIDVEDHDVTTVTIKVRDLVPIVRQARAAIALAK